MARLEELMENEEFITKLEACETEEATKALYAEYSLEITENSSEEISEAELANVTGGAVLTTAFLTIIAPFAWKSGAKMGILIRANYDAKKYGNMYRSYTKKQVDDAMKFFEKLI